MSAREKRARVLAAAAMREARRYNGGPTDYDPAERIFRAAQDDVANGCAIFLNPLVGSCRTNTEKAKDHAAAYALLRESHLRLTDRRRRERQAVA